jgi:symplekin
MMLIVILFSGKVLEILTQGTTPSSDLIATVKHLYETKLKVLIVTKISSVSYPNEIFAILVLM